MGAGVRSVAGMSKNRPRVSTASSGSTSKSIPASGRGNRNGATLARLAEASAASPRGNPPRIGALPTAGQPPVWLMWRETWPETVWRE